METIPSEGKSKSQAVVVWDATGVLAEVVDERTRQNIRWGGNPHDDEHTTKEWNDMVWDWNAKAWDASDPVEWRRRMVQVAALAVAAIESFDRKEKHRQECQEQTPA